MIKQEIQVEYPYEHKDHNMNPEIQSKLKTRLYQIMSEHRDIEYG